MAHIGQYLYKNRYGTYYFRSIIPRSLRDCFQPSQSEIRRSLGTDSYRLAIRKARAMRVQFDQLIDLATDMAKRKKKHHLKVGLITHINLNKNTKTVIEHENPDDERRTFAELLRSEDNQETSSANTISNSKENQSISFEEIAKQYLDVKKNRLNRREKTIKEYRAAIDNFLFIMGNRSVQSLTASDLDKFYEGLRALPKNRTKSKYKDLSYSALQAKQIPTGDLLSVYTTNKIFGRILGLLNFACDKGYIDKNPAKAVDLFVDPRDSKEKRDLFTKDELEKFFCDPVFTQNSFKHYKKNKHPHIFWLPLLALFTGARIGELCQLDKSDIMQTDSGTWYLKIQEEFDGSGQRIKSTKTKSSNREIPLSDELIRIGFIDYCKSVSSKHLFPSLLDCKNPTDAASKRMATIIDRVGIHEHLKKTFYSFRHTFITQAANDVQNEFLISAVTGHMSLSERKKANMIRTVYNKGINPDILKKDVIDKIHFDIDFSHIKWSSK